MGSPQQKADLWNDWVSQTVLADIQAADTPDPVPVFDESGTELERSPEYDSYRLGRGQGDYLYLFYLLDDPVDGPADIIPVYVGETTRIGNRLLNHFRKVRGALPISAWEDDGSRGSYGKYDHIATIYDRAKSPLYAWVVDVDEIDAGPYGLPTYRQELEAQLVGLIHSNPRFNRVFANRDFVPNRVAYEMGQLGPDWVDLEHDEQNEEASMAAGTSGSDLSGSSKADLWYDWVDQTIGQDIRDPESADPIPLFETDENLVVELTESGSSTVLKRSESIDTRIRREGKRCVHREGVTDGPNGLLYVLYQLASDSPSATDIVPRYIGKAEAHGTEKELSTNFNEIAKDRSGTQAFARWGDGSYWHVGELSETVFGKDAKKRSWASELFEQGTHRLQEQTYLWVRAWDPEAYPGPYGYPAYLAEVEALLIGLVYETHPNQLLNHREVPEDAPANQKEFQFHPVSR